MSGPVWLVAGAMGPRRVGASSPIERWTEEEELPFRLSRRAAGRMAADYADHGFAAIIDDIVPDHDFGEYARALDGRPVRRVLLSPPLVVARARNATRTHKATADALVARFGLS